MFGERGADAPIGDTFVKLERRSESCGGIAIKNPWLQYKEMKELNSIDERAVGVIEPDTLLPSQYFDRIRRHVEHDPERRLMIAVLEEGVNDYLKNVGARDPHRRALFADAEHWIEDRDASWLYSFENICNVLGIESDYLRRGLHAWRDRTRRGREEAAPAITLRADERERLRKAGGK